MRITQDQLDCLQKLRCERLSSNKENMRLVDSFENYKNSNIADTLKNEAYGEDEENKVAYYVIKDSDNEILFFFSLKCGLLYDEFLEGKRLEQLKHLYDYLLKIKEDASSSKYDKVTIDSILERVRTKKGLKKKDVERILHTAKDCDDITSFFDDNTQNVGKTFAGVEIVHFCANDELRVKWERYPLNRKMGTVVFWHFIVPKILDLMEIAGCEFLFLFAADNSENEELVNYYMANLQFRKADEHSVAIPLYDFTCKFLYQETKDLRERHETFFANFNREEDAV